MAGVLVGAVLRSWEPQGAPWDLPSLPWGGAGLCHRCSSPFLFCSRGVYPGWEERGGQAVRHAAVAGNEECRGALLWPICGVRLGSGDSGERYWSPTSPFAFKVWTLLPGFCTHPTDVLGAFKGLARTLGMAVSERPDLRPTVCQALRTLIHKGCETGWWGTDPRGGSLSPAVTRRGRC